MANLYELVDKLYTSRNLSADEFEMLLINNSPDLREYAAKIAQSEKNKYYANQVFIRGLIEFTNYCKNNCLYCGIRRGNNNCQRYRLSVDDILNCCKNGYELGFRTFVLQGGEDPYFNDDRICSVISAIKIRFPDCAITLSIGEKSRESYLAYRKAGADRYLLRHETANSEHYSRLHPDEMKLSNRIKCLYDLKELGFQVGAGFMVGSPYQTKHNIAEDLVFLRELNPHMIGIGPFISHKDTPFADEDSGTLEDTLLLLSLIRIMLPDVLLPATTALGTIAHNGRELGILAGANVVMPNLSPVNVRKKYELYNDKICTGEEAAECIRCLSSRVESTGHKIVTGRGDSIRLYNEGRQQDV